MQKRVFSVNFSITDDTTASLSADSQFSYVTRETATQLTDDTAILRHHSPQLGKISIKTG